MNLESDFEVPTGFEIAHEEWLANGAREFRHKYYAGPHDGFYKTRYWALVRQAILARDSLTCFRCHELASYVHHLTYNFTGEDHLHPETLVSVCGPCHQTVEYARLAESLISKINRRISLCTGYLEDRRGCLDQDAAHVYARLLEYQDELDELRMLFTTATPYKNPRIKSREEAVIISDRFRLRRKSCERQAQNLVDTWEGNEKEKAARLPPMLKLEIENCRKFAAEVLKPVSPSIQLAKKAPSAEAANELGRKAGAVEALVVGIKFHRGHTNGINLGDSVRLVHEPHNAHDPNAIRVNLQNGEALGYLTKEVAAILAKQVETDDVFQTRVSKIVRDKVYVAISTRRQL